MGVLNPKLDSETPNISELLRRSPRCVDDFRGKAPESDASWLHAGVCHLPKAQPRGLCLTRGHENGIPEPLSPPTALTLRVHASAALHRPNE